MIFRLVELRLVCRRKTEAVTFSDRLTYLHGQISTGKSSIPRLIDWCLGATLEQTPALQSEMVSCSLRAVIGENDVLFERERDSNKVQVSWVNEAGAETVLVPIAAQSTPVFGESVLGLSDLMFHLMGLPPMKVLRRAGDTESPVWRLSFRDIVPFCYLEQDELDSSFFRLTEPIVQSKSRAVLNFNIGFHSEKLVRLEQELSETRMQKRAKAEASAKILEFLKQYELQDEGTIEMQIDEVSRHLASLQAQLQKAGRDHASETHFADKLRARLREVSGEIDQESTVLDDLISRISEQESLRSEIIASRVKATRGMTAEAILRNVEFEVCPSCGARLVPCTDLSVCSLCSSPRNAQRAEVTADVREQFSSLIADFNSRIEELEVSISEHRNARSTQLNRVEELRRQKAELDTRLASELETYDSVFLANIRQLERESATLYERRRSLSQSLKLPAGLRKLEAEMDSAEVHCRDLERRINLEKEALSDALSLLTELEREFLRALVASKVPGVTTEDTIEIDNHTWMPWVYPGENRSLKWSFTSAGSGGKKTLFKSCFALALHVVAERHDLPLPRLLIIDTPMKNIGEEVNRDVFEAFYHYLYRLMGGDLSQHQVIIIDKEYIGPAFKHLQRLFTTDDPENPPLISYYKGP